MKMNALIQSNLHLNPQELSEVQWAESYAKAVWLEQFRSRNLAQMLAQILGAR